MATMKVFIFHHPVAFPESEYGGMWVVRAATAEAAGVLAWEHYAVDRLDPPVEVFQQAALEGQHLELAHEGCPIVLDCFLT